MLRMKKVFYAFAIILVALIITPNAVMRVLACADCDDEHPTFRFADITPSLAEIDFDALLADVIRDRYEEEGFFIVISMQEVYGQIDVISVEVLNEDQLRLFITYANDEVELLILSSNTQGLCSPCPYDALIFIWDYAIKRWNPHLGMWQWGIIVICSICGLVDFIFPYR